MNEIEQALADVNKEGLDPFADLVPAPSESLPEKPEEVKEEPKQEEPVEDNIPFHKHPRWIERENEMRELREREEQTAKELEELRAFKEELASKTTQDDPIPAWFTELYGENQVAWQKYNEHEASVQAKVEARVLERLQQEQAKATEESDKWNKWVDSEIVKLESKGLNFDRNKLIQTMLEYSPTDEHNNLSFEKGYKIYEALEAKPDTAKSEARKQLADLTTATTPKESPKKDYLTPAELRNRSMMSL